MEVAVTRAVDREVANIMAEIDKAYDAGESLGRKRHSKSKTPLVTGSVRLVAVKNGYPKDSRCHWAFVNGFIYGERGED